MTMPSSSSATFTYCNDEVQFETRRWRHEPGAPRRDSLREKDSQDPAGRASAGRAAPEGLAPPGSNFMRSDTIRQMGSDSELDDLEVEVAAEEENEPGYRARLDQLTEVVRVTTSLWVRREEIGLSVEEVAIRSGLSLDEVEAIENNAVDTPFPNLARYAAAVGLRLDVTVTAA